MFNGNVFSFAPARAGRAKARLSKDNALQILARKLDCPVDSLHFLFKQPAVKNLSESENHHPQNQSLMSVSDIIIPDMRDSLK